MNSEPEVVDVHITLTDIPCPICREGALVVHVEDILVKYAGVRGIVPSRYKVCVPHAAASKPTWRTCASTGMRCGPSRNP